jgi:hypothetical protein
MRLTVVTGGVTGTTGVVEGTTGGVTGTPGGVPGTSGVVPGTYGVVPGAIGVVMGTNSLRVHLSVVSAQTAGGATAVAQCRGTSFPAPPPLPRPPPLPPLSSRVQVPASQQPKLHKFQVLLTSYESVRDDTELFRSIHWRALVISSDYL